MIYRHNYIIIKNQYFLINSNFLTNYKITSIELHYSKMVAKN